MGRRPLAVLVLLPLVFSAAVYAELAGPATVTDSDTLTAAGPADSALRHHSPLELSARFSCMPPH